MMSPLSRSAFMARSKLRSLMPVSSRMRVLVALLTVRKYQYTAFSPGVLVTPAISLRSSSFNAFQLCAAMLQDTVILTVSLPVNLLCSAHFALQPPGT